MDKNKYDNLSNFDKLALKTYSNVNKIATIPIAFDNAIDNLFPFIENQFSAKNNQSPYTNLLDGYNPLKITEQKDESLPESFYSNENQYNLPSITSTFNQESESDRALMSDYVGTPKTIDPITDRGAFLKWREAITANEADSRGYKTIGLVLPSGQNTGFSAQGRYQIMPNLHFSKLGGEFTKYDSSNPNNPLNKQLEQKYLNNPTLQDKLFDIVGGEFIRNNKGSIAGATSSYLGTGKIDLATGISNSAYTNKVLKSYYGTSGSTLISPPSSITSDTAQTELDKMINGLNSSNTLNYTDIVKSIRTIKTINHFI
jgi:hypothetical protein